MNTPCGDEIKRILCWNVARRLGEFSYHQLAAETSINMKYVPPIVKSWIKDGLVEELDEKGPKNRLVFRVVDKTPDTVIPPRKESVQGNMWTAMRGLKHFTPRDIAANATTELTDVSVEDARKYCQLLVRSKYLRVLRKANPPRVDAAYKLIRDTGPMPPRPRRVRGVYDDNKREFVYLPGAGS